MGVLGFYCYSSVDIINILLDGIFTLRIEIFTQIAQLSHLVGLSSNFGNFS